jgi:DNA-binding CsgD family transcriptional regulator
LRLVGSRRPRSSWRRSARRRRSATGGPARRRSGLERCCCSLTGRARRRSRCRKRRRANSRKRGSRSTGVARSSLVAGDALRRLGERRRAAEKLDAAKAVFVELGAELWVERAEQELRRANPRPRRDRELTNAERRVASLVAAGRTNREAAAQLFTTVATVEAHLTRIYRKVGVRSRTELARRVADGTLAIVDD